MKNEGYGPPSVANSSPFALAAIAIVFLDGRSPFTRC
jgi:hypothetical protein